MRHAERLTHRILFLEGLPNYQRLGTLHIGQTVPEQLRADLDIELAVVERLRPGIKLMRDKGDITSARLFEAILDNEEEHIDYLETELGLLEELGEQIYLQRFAKPPSSS
jgi:bacterioferritin